MCTNVFSYGSLGKTNLLGWPLICIGSLAEKIVLGDALAEDAHKEVLTEDVLGDVLAEEVLEDVPAEVVLNDVLAGNVCEDDDVLEADVLAEDVLDDDLAAEGLGDEVPRRCSC